MKERGVGYKLGLLFCLYFSQGLPFGFFSHAVPTLLRSYGVDLQLIGLISFVAFPWGLKFIWAPWVDRYHFSALGQRKSWILPLQAAAILLLLGMSAIDPNQLANGNWWVLFIFLVLINLVAATQDVATDGLAVQSLQPTERGLANGMQVGGYRVGMVFGGGLVLVLIAQLGWQSTFWLLASMLVLVTVPVLFMREASEPLQHSARQAVPAWQTLWQFVSQRGMWRWLLLLMLYKVGDAFGSAMGKPLLVDLGMPLDVIGWVGGGVGMGAGILGAMLGGYWVRRLGRVRALVA